MSLGIHRLWKDKFMERLAPTHGTKLLDMAGGTGDIAFRYIKYLQNLPAGDGTSQSHVTVSDINENMLGVGKERAHDLNYTGESLRNCSIDWVCADAEKLPFADESFNAYTIAFGIRNCTHIDKVCDLNSEANSTISVFAFPIRLVVRFDYSFRYLKKRIVYCSRADDLCAWSLAI